MPFRHIPDCTEIATHRFIHVPCETLDLTICPSGTSMGVGTGTGTGTVRVRLTLICVKH
jgi:hypothetical protein